MQHSIDGATVTEYDTAGEVAKLQQEVPLLRAVVAAGLAKFSPQEHTRFAAQTKKRLATSVNRTVSMPKPQEGR